MRNIFIISLCLSLFASSTNAQRVKKVTVGEDCNFGITYSLPMTEICATVNAVSTQTVAGVYAPYAEKYLGLKDVATKDQTLWEVSDITLEGVAIPDDTKKYHIDFPEKGALPQFYLSDEGMLLSINREPEVMEIEPKPIPADEPKKLSLKATDVLSEEILKAGSKAKQAELTAREIFSIRESRRELLKGEVENMPKDGASYQIVLDNLNAQEQALLSLFVGTTTVTKVTKTFRFTPFDSKKDMIFFRFSSYFGFVDTDDVVGEPYYLNVDVTDNKREEIVAENTKKQSPLGIAYNVPGKAHVSLSFDNDVIAEGDMIMGQFGHVEQLPATRFTDKKTKAAASFNPLTGSIKIYE